VNPILQFGTSRFLQAHVDLFVCEALSAGAALGSITVLQTTDSAQSARRIAAFNRGEGFPVRVRGLRERADRLRTTRQVDHLRFAGEP
jgi:tagaturonate reductase